MPVNSESQFQGVIDEIPHIAVDYFLNVQSSLALFLSHCHADHMKGLDSHDLYHTVRTKPGLFIYCSGTTKKILTDWPIYSKLAPYFKVLELNHTVKIDFPGGYCSDDNSSKIGFCVTSIPSGHCPGSVMFLYEGPFGTVLYTGDFRIAKGDSRKFQAFMSNPSRPEYGLKTIDHVYLDCTFCTDSAKTFPSRQTSVDITIDLVSSWIAKSPEHKVLFTLAGRGFGAEFLFVEVYRKLKLQVHTSDFKHQIYSNLSDIKNAISRQRTTSIHACETMMSSKKQSPCFKDSNKVLTIRLSTQWHLMDGKNIDNRVLVGEEGGIQRVLFSMHSSLEEIQDMVQTLQPRKVTPIAKPDLVTKEKIAQLLNCKVAMPTSRFRSRNHDD
ncbi:protein artemis-like [Daphnia pulex]|uniref:protein artemis-like n=1 Tax=Daphnia pulex TaxID=6669 RepID=UPI001EDDAAE0|nr:protein artemis-like [Daphnia pulex]